MTEEQLRAQMVVMARSLFERGYATGGAGNLSLRLPDGNILTTPTGSSLGRLQAENLSVVGPDGTHISGLRPSKEADFHLSIYHHKPECNAIVHLHSTYLTALSCLKDLDTYNAIRPFTPYFVMRIGKLPVIPYFRPGCRHIGEALSKLAPGHRAFLMANHGSVVTGKDFSDAVDNAEELEETAKLLFLLKPHQINYLTDEAIAELSQGVLPTSPSHPATK